MGSSKFPIGQLDFRKSPYIRQQSSQVQSVYNSLFLLCTAVKSSALFQCGLFCFFFQVFILEQDIFRQQPLVTHYTPHIPNRGWVSSWILSIPCLSLSSSSTHVCSLPSSLKSVCFIGLFVPEQWKMSLCWWLCLGTGMACQCGVYLRVGWGTCSGLSSWRFGGACAWVENLLSVH